MAEPFSTLRLEVVTDLPVLAREGGRMVERLANAFDQMVRSGRLPADNARLRLERVAVGSLTVDLGIVSILAYVAFDHREALTQFVSYLADALQLIRSFRADETAPADRSAIEALASPVAKGNATQVNLFVFGENERRLEIGRELAETVIAALGRPRPVDQETEMRSIAVQAPRVAPTQREGRLIDYARSAAPFEDVPPGTNGTMIWINDRWFVRPDGMNGGMLPMEGNPAVGELDRSRTYGVEGRILTHGNLPTGFVPMTIHGPLT
jgi:hypothetical protein